MTRLDMQARLQNVFENASYYTSDDFNASIQDGYDEVCAFSGCILKGTTIPFKKNVTYYDFLSLIPDFIGVIAIFNQTMNRWMFPISIRKLDQLRIDWECAGGTPYYFSQVSHRYIAIFMKPLTDGYGNMQILYRASAPTLGDTDLIQLPTDQFFALESYSILDLWEQQQEFKKASLYFNKYIENLASLSSWVHSQRIPDRAPSLK